MSVLNKLKPAGPASKIEWPDWKMKFDTEADLRNHQDKFWKQYSKVDQLDSRLQKLNNLGRMRTPKKVFKKSEIEINEKEMYKRKQELEMKRAADRQKLETIMENQRKFGNNVPSTSKIEDELKEIRKMKAGYLKETKENKLKTIEDQKRELDEEKRQINAELNQLDRDMMHSVENEHKKVHQKVIMSEYLNDNKRNSKLEMIKRGAEDQARFRYKQEILNKQKQNISGLNSNIKISDMLKSNYTKNNHKSNLSNAGADILDNPEVNEAYGLKIKQSEDRISKLVKDRDRTLREINNDDTFDELDQLKYQIDKGILQDQHYSTDGEVYRKGIKEYAIGIRSERDLSAREKADRLGNIRRALKSRDRSQDVSNKVNYQAAKPIMDKKLIQLNQLIQREKEREIRDERIRASQNMNAKLPDYSKLNNNSVLNEFWKTDRNEHRQPLIDQYEKASSKGAGRNNLNDRINKSLNDAAINNRTPNGKMFLPDIGSFKQNLTRAEDLEKEERAIMNMYAQDFDELKVLNLLSKNDELYNHKLDQYKKTSSNRIQAEKILQQQRLDLLRRHNARENYEEDRKLELEKWMEDQEKNLVSQKIQERVRAPPTPEYRPPTPVKTIFAERQLRKEPVYEPEIGFGFHMDSIINIERNISTQMKVAYAIFNRGDMIVGNKHMGPVLISGDDYSVMQQKAQFSMKHAIKLIDPDIDSNLILEIQIPDKNDSYQFQALGWTLINLFDFKSGNINAGIYKLPLYHLPTNPNLSVNDILKELTQMDSYV